MPDIPTLNHKPKIYFRSFIFYGITLAALFLIFLKIGELRTIWQLLINIDSNWVTAIIGLQIASYYFLTLNYRDVLKMKGLLLSWVELFPMTFVIQFLNQAFPSASIAGQVFFVNYLRRYKLSISEGIGRAILEFATLYSAFGILFIGSIILILRNGIFESHWEVRYLIYFFSFIALTFLTIFFALQRKKRTGIGEWLINKIHRAFENNQHIQKLTTGAAAKHLEHVKTILQQIKSNLRYSELKPKGWIFGAAVLWQTIVLVLQIITIYVIALTIGEHIPMTIVVIVFTLTKFLSMITIIPGALGVFEGSMTLMFISFGIPSAIAISVTLIFRAFSFWLPMPIGWLLYRHYQRQH